MRISHLPRLARAVAALAFLFPVLAPAQQVVMWPRTNAIVPPDAESGVVDIATGVSHTIALKSNGGVVGWGTTVPMAAWSGVVQIAANNASSLALKSDGTIVGWSTSGAPLNIPEEGRSGVLGIAASGTYSFAFKANGKLVQLGGGGTPPATVNSGVVAVSAGDYFAIALKSDGRVVAWGTENYGGALNVPAEAQSGVVAISADRYHSLALKSNGRVIAWGENDWGQSTVPPAAQSGVVAIAAGSIHNIALKADGSVIGWGNNNFGQTDIPVTAMNSVVAISARGQRNVALRSNWIDFAPSTVYSGEATMATLHIDRPAPAGGLVIPLSDDEPAVRVPESVTVPAGATQVTFPITSVVSFGTDHAVTVPFDYKGATVVSSFTLKAYSASLSLSPTAVSPGETSTGTIKLGTPAPMDGITFALSSDDATVHVPATVTVPAGTTITTFPITTDVSFGPQRTVNIGIAYGNYSKTATLTLKAQSLGASFNLSGIIVGSNQDLRLAINLGSTFTQDVRLLLSGPSGLRLPNAVVVPAGKTGIEVPLVPNATVPLGGVTATVAYKEKPLASVPLNTNPMQAVVQFNPNQVIAGGTLTAKVRLNESTRAATKVSLTSDDPNLTFPKTVTVPANEREASFTIKAPASATSHNVLMTATLGGVSNNSSLRVIANSVTEMTLSPSSVKGGGTATATVTLRGVSAANTVVTLASLDTTLATVPNKVIVPAGQLTATFTVTTKAVTKAKNAKITATLDNTLTRSLQITP